MCESADDFYEARYLFTQHSLDHGALPCWVTINKNRRGSINFYTTRILEAISFTVSAFRFVLMKDDIPNTGYLF